MPEIPAKLRPPLVAALSLLTGLGWTLVSILITTQSLRSVLSWMGGKPLAVLACALMLGLLTAFFALITRSLFAGGLIVALPVLAATFVNYFKVLITSTPFQLSDMVLIGKVGNIANLNSGSITFSRNSVLALAAVAVWLLVLLYFSKPLRVSLRAGLISAAASAALFALLFGTAAVADRWCFGPLGVPTDTNYGQAHLNAQCGVPLGLWRSFLGAGAGYDLEDEDESAILQDAQGYVDDIPSGGESGKKPNVVVVLSESFFDVTGLPGVSYDRDPLADFHAACEEGVSGRFYTRTLGYGTCDIELQILTGINNRFLTSDEMLCYWSGDRFDKLAAVPRVFSENGYRTAFMHTFNDEIYGRTPMYEHLGFEDIYFSGDFAQVDPQAAAAPDYWAYMEDKIAGEFYSDDYMGDLIIDLYEREEEPLFLFAVTMENHTPFSGDKYESYDYGFTADISEDAAGVLNAVTQGAADSSAMLGKLTEYFSKCEEPTVIIFFGDHRPGLPLEDGGTLYSQLGMGSVSAADWSTEETAELYSTDYVIWANDPALLPAEAGSREDSSCAYLGLQALEAADMPLDPYWRMIASVRESCTAYTWHFAVSAEGAVSAGTESLAAEDRRKLAVMTWLMRQALSGDEPAFYLLK